MGALPIAVLEKNCFPIISGRTPYVATQWTVDTGGTGGAIAEATTAGGGILATAASDADFNWSIQSKQLLTPTAGKVITCIARIQVSAIDGIGFHLGFGTTQVLPFTTDFTDKIVIQKAILAGAVTGVVRGNAGTAAASATLGTMVNATEIEVGFEALIAATAAGCRVTWLYNGARMAQTATVDVAQRAQLLAMLTTPQSMYLTADFTGVTGTNPTATVTLLQAEVDR
jgi:hypothetical protein